MPDGLDTVVHERGQTLSSGERQLIALARAFLAHPRVLVLDEATSNLDLKSETKIEAALDVLLEDRTAILIAHRLSTAMRADRIAVVDGGRIVEVGTPCDAGRLQGALCRDVRDLGAPLGGCRRDRRVAGLNDLPGAGPPAAGQSAGGCRSDQGAAVSSCAATASSCASRQGPATSWTPTGRPDAASCRGRLIAGWPVML